MLTASTAPSNLTNAQGQWTNAGTPLLNGHVVGQARASQVLGTPELPSHQVCTLACPSQYSDVSKYSDVVRVGYFLRASSPCNRQAVLPCLNCVGPPH